MSFWPLFALKKTDKQSGGRGGKARARQLSTLPPSFAISFFFWMAEAQKAVVRFAQPSVPVQNGTPPSVLSDRNRPQMKSKPPSPFFESLILNSPYKRPSRHWELNEKGRPTNRILSGRRGGAFVAPVPKSRRRKQSQDEMIYEEIVDGDQQYQKLAHIVSIRASSGICPKPNGG